MVNSPDPVKVAVKLGSLSLKAGRIEMANEEPSPATGFGTSITLDGKSLPCISAVLRVNVDEPLTLELEIPMEVLTAEQRQALAEIS